MTIAIGYLCHMGVIVAADTAVIAGTADLQEGSKLTTFVNKSGSFAFVTSSMDANSTETLVTDITNHMQTVEVSTYRDLEQGLKQRMTEWRRAFGGRKPPETTLILGAKLKGKPPKLFLCEPPNTVTEKGDYIAAGWGAAVTDPLYNTLFAHDGGEWSDVQKILRRVAYLLYRAKKDNVYCGKRSECAVINRDGEFPSEVDWEDMAKAEEYSKQLDILFSGAAMFVFGSATTSLAANDLLEMFNQTSALLQSVVFRDDYGDEIRLR